MFAVHFYENQVCVLNQALRTVPAAGDSIRIKGRNGKVTSVEALEGIHYAVAVEFEKIVDKKKAALKELDKKRRR